MGNLCFHVISSEVSLANGSLRIDHIPLALAPVVAPLTIVQLVLLCVEHPPLSAALAILVVADVNVAGARVVVFALLVAFVVQPAALV